jgi:hypothetical protein
MKGLLCVLVGAQGNRISFLGIASTGCITTNTFSKLCCASTHNKLFERLDAIALGRRPGDRST